MESRQIDWDGVHRRLESVESAISGTLAVSPEKIRDVLEARARALSKSPEKPDDSEYFEILAFTLSGEMYGVETRCVREVCPLKDLTPIPCTPPFISGVMNLRGQILAVIDLRIFFELPPRGLTELNRVIVLRDESHEFGLLADFVEGVRTIAAMDVQKSLPTLNGIRERYLKGVTGRMLALLDGDRLLDDADLTVNEQVTH